MEQENVQNVAVETTTENTEVATVEEKATEKTFTQDEVNEMIKTRLKNMPSKEEIEEYKSWKESQKTPDEIQTELNQKISTLENDYSSLKEQNLILKSGVTDIEDVEYIQFKVSKLDGNFEDNLKKYLEENPKFTKKEEPKTTGFSQNVTNIRVSEEKSYLDKKYGNNPYYKK